MHLSNHWHSTFVVVECRHYIKEIIAFKLKVLVHVSCMIQHVDRYSRDWFHLRQFLRSKLSYQAITRINNFLYHSLLPLGSKLFATERIKIFHVREKRLHNVLASLGLEGTPLSGVSSKQHRRTLS